MADNHQTPEDAPEFDFHAYPENTCFHERRSQEDRRQSEEAPPAEGERRKRRKERRKRIDPTTFEKQYTAEELEFMNAMQRYKDQSGKTFPSYEEVLRVARRLGYIKTGPRGEIPGMPNKSEPNAERGRNENTDAGA